MARETIVPADQDEACPARRLRASPLFDARWYWARYPDVRAAGLDPLHHYLEHGVAEGRDPGPRFSTERYLIAHPELAASGRNPLLDYLARGGSAPLSDHGGAVANEGEVTSPNGTHLGGEAVVSEVAGRITPPVHQSCDPARLYAQGGFPAEPLDLERLRREGAAGEAVGELFPAYRYQRPVEPDTTLAPAGFKAEVEATQSLVNAHADRGAPSRLYRIPDAVLCDSVIATLRDGEPKIVYETHRPQDRATLPDVDLSTIGAAPRWEEDGELFVFLGSSGSFNYGHWLVDDLPRLSSVNTLNRLHPRRTIILVLASQDDVIDPIRRQSIDLVLPRGSDVRVMIVPRAAALRFPALFFATPVTRHPYAKSPEALRWLRRRLLAGTRGMRARFAWHRAVAALAKGNGAPGVRRRLFVDRGPLHTRALTNGDEVFEALRSYGFERVQPDAMSFASQVATFAGAELVVGTMGAGMTNTLVCRPGTAVIQLAPEGWQEPFYWDLAAVMGHRYHAVYGPAVTADYTSPYRVDIATVVKLVTRYAEGGPGIR